MNLFFCYYVDKLSTYEWNGLSNIKGCVSESWGLWTSVSLYHALPAFFCSHYNFLIQLAREHLLHRLYVYNVLLVINALLRQRMWLVPAITVLRHGCKLAFTFWAGRRAVSLIGVVPTIVIIIAFEVHVCACAIFAGKFIWLACPFGWLHGYKKHKQEIKFQRGHR